MDYCHIEFTPAAAGTLSRTQQVFELIRGMKSGEVEQDEAQLTALLTDAEKSYFWNPTPEELAEWNSHWQSTPVAIRISAAMVTPQWDLGSIYEALWNGEYELVSINLGRESHYLVFNPEAYPYGGVGALIAFVECFGHTVIGYDDGTGYVAHQPRPVWLPRSGRRKA